MEEQLLVNVVNAMDHCGHVFVPIVADVGVTNGFVTSAFVVTDTQISPIQMNLHSQQVSHCKRISKVGLLQKQTWTSVFCIGEITFRKKLPQRNGNVRSVAKSISLYQTLSQASWHIGIGHTLSEKTLI